MIEAIAFLIGIMIAPNPRHPLAGDAEAITDLAGEIVEAGDEYHVHPEVLTVWAFYESSFRKHAVGELGEIGYMQTHGKTAKMCEKAGIDRDSIKCGAYIMRQGFDICGSLRRGLNWYASGKCVSTKRTADIVEFRLKKVKKWKS